MCVFVYVKEMCVCMRERERERERERVCDTSDAGARARAKPQHTALLTTSSTWSLVQGAMKSTACLLCLSPEWCCFPLPNAWAASTSHVRLEWRVFVEINVTFYHFFFAFTFSMGSLDAGTEH